jgi:hypothetical protein
MDGLLGVFQLGSIRIDKTSMELYLEDPDGRHLALYFTAKCCSTMVHYDGNVTD